MPNSAKDRGNEAEREAATKLGELLGIPLRRKLGAGRLDDRGDLDGVPDTVLQVAYRPSDTLRAVREKPDEAERQRINDGADFAITLVRMRRGLWRAVLTLEQIAALLQEVIVLRHEYNRLRREVIALKREVIRLKVPPPEQLAPSHPAVLARIESEET